MADTIQQSDAPSLKVRLKEKLQEVSRYIDELSGDDQQKALAELEDLLKRDRRDHPRVPCSIPVSCATEVRAFQDLVRDISAGGAFVETSEPCSPDEQITLTFSSPALQAPITITGRIAWTSPHGIGVKFSSPREDLEAVILSL